MAPKEYAATVERERGSKAHALACLIDDIEAGRTDPRWPRPIGSAAARRWLDRVIAHLHTDNAALWAARGRLAP